VKLRTVLAGFCLFYLLERNEGAFITADAPRWKREIIFNPLTDWLVDLFLRYLNATKGGG